MVLEMENTNEEDIEDETNILHIVDDNNQLVRYKKVLIPFRFKKKAPVLPYQYSSLLIKS